MSVSPDAWVSRNCTDAALESNSSFIFINMMRRPGTEKNSMEHKVAAHPRQAFSLRLWLTAGVVIAYMAAFVPLSRLAGGEAAALTPLPVLVIGGLWGMRAGILAGALGIPVNLGLLLLAGRPDWNVMALPQNIAAAAGSISIGAVAGYMHNLRQRVKQERAARKLTEAELRKSEHRYHSLIETAPDVIYRLTSDGTITSLNPAFEKITGWPSKELIGRPFTHLLHPDDVPIALKGFEQVIVHGQTPPPVELRVLSKSGQYLVGEFSSAPLIEDGKVIGEFGVARDVTERKQAEQRLRHVAYYDSLTGLPNRELFNDRLRQALIQVRRYRRILAVMFLDLDRFKSINDTLGHKAGDLLLRSASERLVRCVREGDTVARLGGDEFIILFPDILHARDAAVVAKKINKALTKSFALYGQKIFITASIGVSIYPLDGIDVDTLIKNADVAMYQAKAQGRNNYQFYTPTMNAEALRKLILENNLQGALERDEFRLHYQPLVELSTGRIVGTEALLRWQHPGLGLLLPVDFIPLAEETGLIIPMGEWLLQKVCAQGKAWQEAGFPPLRMAVNLSMRQFNQNTVSGTISQALERTGFDPRSLELEITESIVMQNAEQTIATLHELKSLGLRLSIDDFGTGYSSLSYLKDLPLSTLKLDQSFVSALTKNTNDEAISKAIITLAHNLNLKVTAEGVETVGQLEFLRSLDCDEVQGFLFSEAIPADEMTRLMTEGWN